MTQELINLLSQWQQRQSSSNNQDYKIAIAECYEELQHIVQQSQDYKDYMDKYFNEIPSEELEEYFNDSQAEYYISDTHEYSAA